jgi:hypothetical protein
LRDLLTGILATDRRTGRRRSVREIVADFEGLKRSATASAVIEEAGLYKAMLADLVKGDEIPLATVERLLHAMQGRARAVPPKSLGVVGEASLRATLTTVLDVDPETITYKSLLETCPEVELPYVVEVACGWSTTEGVTGRQLTGLNWTPALRPPFPGWQSLMNACRLDAHDQASLLVHVACPYLAVTDRAKSAVTLPHAIAEALQTAVTKAAKAWTRLKRSGDKDNRVSQRAIEDEAKRQRQQQITIKEAAWQVMEQAYLKASDNGRLPANARQIMYAARPLVIALRDPAPIWKNDSQFTQGYLPDFLAAHPELTRNWDVVYDDRGHFTEPHTRKTFGLGTLKVRRYRQTWDGPRFTTPDGQQWALDEVETSGPMCRYTHVLFLEKEGFDALLDAGAIAQRYDLGIMSTKGQTVTAARALIEALSRQGVTVLVAHDFDKAGIEILDKFSSDTRRFTYTAQTNVIDLGLRLLDVEAMGLESEPAEYGDDKDPRVNLERCGASEEEVAFLVARQDYYDRWHGQRVELNAMTSRQFLDWLEAKFAEHGVEKVVPDEETLAKAYQHLARNAALQREIDKILADLPEAETFTVPDGLAETLRTTIAGTPQSWDQALWEIAQAATQEDEADDA